MRRPRVEVDVGLHHEIPVAHVSGELRRRSVARRLVHVEILRVLLVEVDEHRQLLAGLIAVRNRERSLKLVAVFVRVVEQHATTPAILRLLRVGVGQLFRSSGKIASRPGDPGTRTNLPA